MAYNSAIPQPTDQISVSQGDLLGNFQALANVVLANNGAITFPNQGVAPTFPANQDGLYALTPALTSLSELFVSKNIFGGGTAQIPFTASILSTSTPASGVQGWSYLPSGIIIQWGSGGINDTNNLFAVTFPIAFPTQCLAVVISPTQSSNGNTPPIVFTGAISTTQVFVGGRNGASSNTSGYRYIALGY